MFWGFKSHHSLRSELRQRLGHAPFPCFFFRGPPSAAPLPQLCTPKGGRAPELDHQEGVILKDDARAADGIDAGQATAADTAAEKERAEAVRAEHEASWAEAACRACPVLLCLRISQQGWLRVPQSPGAATRCAAPAGGRSIRRQPPRWLRVQAQLANKPHIDDSKRVNVAGSASRIRGRRRGSVGADATSGDGGAEAAAVTRLRKRCTTSMRWSLDQVRTSTASPGLGVQTGLASLVQPAVPAGSQL